MQLKFIKDVHPPLSIQTIYLYYFALSVTSFSQMITSTILFFNIRITLSKSIVGLKR